ncbi:MAG: hypothetical protein ACFCUG_10430 [Thiotrichales bacterium]
MAMLTFLEIKAAGEDAPVLFGEDNTHGEWGGADVSAWLECSGFESAYESGQESAGAPRGRRLWRPAQFVLRLGKSTPWLFEAARTNKRIDLTLHLFHRHPETSEIELNFAYRIRGGRISALRLVQPDPHDQTSAHVSNRLELSVLPHTVEIESLTGSTMMVDDWGNSAVR